jgi:hypothetical protein
MLRHAAPSLEKCSKFDVNFRERVRRLSTYDAASTTLAPKHVRNDVRHRCDEGHFAKERRRYGSKPSSKIGASQISVIGWAALALPSAVSPYMSSSVRSTL